VLQIVQQYRQGKISADNALEIIEKHLKSRPQIEQLAIEKGYLSMKQLRRLLQIQETCTTPFERLAIREGYLTEQQIGTLLFEQFNRARPIIVSPSSNAASITTAAEAVI
jgi:hypothetical protein